MIVTDGIMFSNTSSQLDRHCIQQLGVVSVLTKAYTLFDRFIKFLQIDARDTDIV